MGITELSVSFCLSGEPAVPVCDDVLHMVDSRFDDTERVVHRSQVNQIPDWVTNCRRKTLRFVYASPVQNVECTYLSQKRILVCSKIKYKNMDRIDWNVLSDMLHIKLTGIASVRFKAVETIAISRPWNGRLVADMITNDAEISQVMALCERSNTMGNKRLFSVAVDVGSETYAKAVLTRGMAPTSIVIMMSKLPSIATCEIIASAFRDIFVKYEAAHDAISGEKFGAADDGQAGDKIGGIKFLRSELPELFVHNYTRESPVLPLMISELEAAALPPERRVIFFPNDEKFGRFYTAPDGYFVGLKKNRLRNSDAFPYIVTCYLSDHMHRPGSETYNYYYAAVSPAFRSGLKSGEVWPENLVRDFSGGTWKAAGSSKLTMYSQGSLAFRAADDRTEGTTRTNRPIPKAIVSRHLRYQRKKVGVPSFVSALEAAIGVSIDASGLPWCPQLVKQEMWRESDDEIMAAIRDPMSTAGSSTYRYFEELLCISIHVVVIKNGSFNTLVPQHEGPYVWEPPYDQHIVIFENFRKTYGSVSCTYDVLMHSSTLQPGAKALQVPPLKSRTEVSNRGDSFGLSEAAFAEEPGRLTKVSDRKQTVFDIDDPVIESIVSEKRGMSVDLPSISMHDVSAQVIDESGKCRLLIYRDGSVAETYTRPVCADVVETPVCFFDDHISKLNIVKGALGVKTIDASKRSNNNIFYFPNDMSFEHWIKHVRGK